MIVGILLMVMVCLSDGEFTGCSVGTIITASELSRVSISCPSIMANSDEVNFLLLFNGSCIRQIDVKEQRVSAEDLSSSQFEVTANNSGMYICQRKKIYPPPYNEDCHATEVIVTEKPFTPAINDTVPEARQSCPASSSPIPQIIMWSVCGVLLFYSLSVTYISIFVLGKPKRDKDDTNVYANTRPGQPRKLYKA